MFNQDTLIYPESSGSPRSGPTPARLPALRISRRQRLILALGLSPWSMGTRCDYCASVPAYLARHGIPRHGELVQVGRWQMHSACLDDAMLHGLSTLALPPLDYAPFSQYSPALQIELMKMVLLESAQAAMLEAQDSAVELAHERDRRQAGRTYRYHSRSWAKEKR